MDKKGLAQFLHHRGQVLVVFFLCSLLIVSISSMPFTNVNMIPTTESPPSFMGEFSGAKNIAGQPESNYETGDIKISKIDLAVMVYVPQGYFPMGSADGSADEQPVHNVFLDAFWIDSTEVTNRQYRKCVDAGDCALPIDPTYINDTSLAQHPVVFVDWEDALTYCEWAGRRLPTEAEWEKAARGTDGRTYPWGEESDCSRANFFDCPEFEFTSPVGQYGERGLSPYKAHDMAGNVWEWVSDWYDLEYYQNSPVFNPRGPSSGIFHVWRGGSWNCNQTSARSAGRGKYNPIYWQDLIGFRCAMSVN